MIVDPDLGRLCLFFDVDGTLLDIAERPELVQVPDRLKADLGILNDGTSGALALVSGREVKTLDRLFTPLRLRASGVHGAELRFDPQLSPVVNRDNLLPPRLVEELRDATADLPGTLVEDKGYSAAVHYRRAPEVASMLAGRIDAILARGEVDGLRAMPGHMVFDLKRVTFDKGKAIARFMDTAPFLGRRPVFIGDDVTDEPGFAAVVERGGYAFSVGQARQGASDVFPDPQSVRDWLSGLAALETSHA